MMNNRFRLGKINKYSFFAFILGLTVAEDISIVFTVNNTGFTIATVYNVILFAYLAFSKQSSLRKAIHNVPLAMKLYFLLCIVSIIPAVFYFETTSVFLRYFVGIIALALVITALLNAIILSDYKEKIFLGFLVGLVINVLISLIALVSFKTGKVLSLSALFDHGGGFYVPRYSFRAQGIFLEPSHFLRFIVSTFLIIVFYCVSLKKNTLLKLLVLLFSFVVLVYSGSGSVVIVFVLDVLYFIFSKKKKTFNIGSVFLFFIVSGIVLYLILTNKELISSYVDDIISGGNITSSGNEYRFNSMITYLEFIPSAPLGIGYNLTGTLRSVNGIAQAAAFSEYIEMTLELGLIGMFVYSFFMVSVIIKLFLQKNNYSLALALSIIGILVLQIGTDYPPDCCVAIVLGLAIAQIRKREKGGNT